MTFQREDRYIVIKRSDFSKCSSRGVVATFLHASRDLHDSIFRNGFPARRYLVIESDWPEYKPAWAMIEARMSGAPSAQPGGAVLPPDDQAEIDRLHAEFIAIDEPSNEQVMTFQDASYALGLKRGQAREAALQQRLNEADQRLDEATQRVRESQAELLEMKASVGYRGFTLEVIGRNDHFLNQLTKARPTCCVQTAAEKALLASGDYTPEELYGVGGKPSCPKCHKATATDVQLTKDSPEVGS